MASLAALFASHLQAKAQETAGITLRANIFQTPSLTNVHLPVAKHSKQADHSEFIKSDITNRVYNFLCLRGDNYKA